MGFNNNVEWLLRNQKAPDGGTTLIIIRHFQKSCLSMKKEQSLLKK